jgi:hypothetical protein
VLVTLTSALELSLFSCPTASNGQAGLAGRQCVAGRFAAVLASRHAVLQRLSDNLFRGC